MKNSCLLKLDSQEFIGAMPWPGMAVNFWVKSQGIYAVGIHLTMSLVLWAFPHDADQLQILWPTPISSSYCSWAIGEVCKDLSAMVIKQIAPSIWWILTLVGPSFNLVLFCVCHRHSLDFLAYKYHPSLIPCADISIFLFLYTVGHFPGNLGNRRKLDA